MFRFNDDELEAAIVTYNRPICIKELLERYAKDFIARNVKLSIYDSSEGNDTYAVIREFNSANSEYIEYHKVDSSVVIGDKPILAMLGSKCKYIWVIVDRRLTYFDDLDQYIFPKVKADKYQAIILPDEARIKSLNLPDEKEYGNLQECLKENLGTLQWFGQTIFKRDIFDGFSYNEKLIDYIRNEFNNELVGYRCIGFEILALSQVKSNFKAYMHLVSVDLYCDNSAKAWGAHFYRYAFGESVDILKYITKGSLNSDDYVKKFHNTYATKTYLFSDESLYAGRVESDLQEIYDELLGKGYFDYIEIDKSVIEFYAKAPMDKVRRRHLYDTRHECLDSDLKIGIDIIMPKIRRTSKVIYIYGAGHGGKVISEILEKEGIPIAGFVDKNAGNIKKIKDVNVYTLAEIDSNNSILIVSIKKIIDEVKEQCIAAGFSDNFYYLCELIAK